MAGHRTKTTQRPREPEPPRCRTTYTVAGPRFDPNRFLRDHPTKRQKQVWRSQCAYLTIGETGDRKTSGVVLTVSEARNERVHMAEVASFVRSEAAFIAAAHAPGRVHYLETEVDADPVGPSQLVLPPALAASLARLALPWILVVDLPHGIFDDAPPEEEPW